MVPGDLHGVRSDLVAEHDEVPAVPPGAGDQQAAVVEEMRRLGDILRARILGVQIVVGKLAEPADVVTECFEVTEGRERQHARQGHAQFIQPVVDPGRDDRLAAGQVIVQLGDRAVALQRRVEHVEAAVVPPAAGAAALQGVSARAADAPRRAVIRLRLRRLERVEQGVVTDPARARHGQT